MELAIMRIYTVLTKRTIIVPQTMVAAVLKYRSWINHPESYLPPSPSTVQQRLSWGILLGQETPPTTNHAKTKLEML
jgi:hypothetical protein